MPERNGLPPEYEQRHFTEGDKRGRLRLVASHDGRDNSLTIHQDADLFAALLAIGEKVTHQLRPGRHAWVQVAGGSLMLNGETLKAGDGAAVTDERTLALTGTEDAEVLLFDLA